jgi:hypothetical protein
MVYDLNEVPGFKEFVENKEGRKEKAETLNLKYHVWNNDDGSHYYIIKYNKEWLNMNPKNGLLRSVILNEDNEVISFAPPKSMNQYEYTNDSNIRVEEFIEGIMLNIFYDKEKWNIATRSNIGGTNSFFTDGDFSKDRTFGFMFDDICKEYDVDLTKLNKKYVYSFVLQHPNQRIVKPIVNKAIYLVEVYEIDGMKIESKNISDFPEVEEIGLQLPFSKKVETKEEYEQLIKENCSENTSYDIVGIIFKDVSGTRYKFRNPSYENVRKLRGNQPKLQYQYLNLRKHGKVGEYLKYYKEHSKFFNDYRDLMHQFTGALFKNYISCYVKKEQELNKFPQKFKTHMYRLHHELFLPKLRPEGKYVNKQVVINYVNELPVPVQMFSLNYDMREQFKNIKKEEIISQDVKPSE